MNKLIMITVASVALVGCGKGRSNNPFRAAARYSQAPELQKNSWIGDCESSRKGWFTKLAHFDFGSKYPNSSRSEIRFDGDAATIKEVHYFGNNCDGGEAYVFMEKGSFTLGDKDKNEKNNAGRFIDIHMNRVDAAVMGDEGAAFANKYGLCGNEDWKTGDKGRDVTAQAADGNCYGVTPKRTIANVYQVDNQKLVLGYTGDDAVMPESRPETLDTKHVFHKP